KLAEAPSRTLSSPRRHPGNRPLSSNTISSSYRGNPPRDRKLAERPSYWLSGAAPRSISRGLPASSARRGAIVTAARRPRRGRAAPVADEGVDAYWFRLVNIV